MADFVASRQDLGAVYLGGGRCRFTVWAPVARRVEVHLISPADRTEPMQRDDAGYHHAQLDGVAPGSLYLYRLDGAVERPDPASRFQPRDVHGPSEVVDPGFPWEDGGWSGGPLPDYIIYEIHVGTFTPEGTFDAVIPHLEYLADLGVTAVEIMPVAQFPGGRNWGYDGVYPYAVQGSYGGPEGLKRLVDGCHRHGLAVVLDVVYNHLGPEGNYLRDFGPYFTDRYRTPWGAAINFDGPQSDEVRRYFVENALYWITEFHIDALRLDAVHAIYDRSARPFLEELADAVHRRAEQLNRRIHVIAESDLNDARLIRPPLLGGYGLDAQWSDDLHHSLHALLTGEREGYYRDFGAVWQLGKAYREGYVYDGQHSPYRKRRHGSSTRFCAAHQFVVCSQNHDQVGNRMLGERLSQMVSFEELKLAAGAVLLSPFVPLLFMGEEYAEKAPFQYFISHLDAELVEAVRRGRREEFSSFAWRGEPPDPQDEATFLSCKLDHSLRLQGSHRTLLGFYGELIRLRRALPALRSLSKESVETLAYERDRVLLVRRWCEDDEVVAVFNFGDARPSFPLLFPAGRWEKRLDSAEAVWRAADDPRKPRGAGPVPVHLVSEGTIVLGVEPRSLVLFQRTVEA